MLITKKKERSHSIGGASTGEVIIHGEAEKKIHKVRKRREDPSNITYVFSLHTHRAHPHTHIYIYINQQKHKLVVKLRGGDKHQKNLY